jgi:enoyl-CoA hydratase/carnithine racemase
VNRVVPDDELDTAMEELVTRITRSSRLVTEIGKQAFYAQADLDEHGAYDLVRAVMSSNAQLDDAQEGMDAFVGKRRPAWRNK